MARGLIYIKSDKVEKLQLGRFFKRFMPFGGQDYQKVAPQGEVVAYDPYKNMGPGTGAAIPKGDSSTFDYDIALDKATNKEPLHMDKLNNMIMNKEINEAVVADTERRAKEKVIEGRIAEKEFEGSMSEKEASDKIVDESMEKAKVIKTAEKEKSRISKIQQTLIDYGFLNNDSGKAADGIFGKNTLKALEKVRAIQRKLGVDDDGIIGSITMGAAKKAGLDIKDVAKLQKEAEEEKFRTAFIESSGLKGVLTDNERMDEAMNFEKNRVYRKGGLLQYSK